jgi:type II secretory pathway pseudopilin PulG
VTIEARLIVYAVLLALLAGAGFVVNGWRKAADKLPQVEMRLAATLAAQETARRIRQEVTQDYADELKRLRDIAGRGPRVIRVCDAPSLPGPGAAPGGTDDPGTGGGELPQAAGRDIGPALYAEAERADALAAQLRALQAWARKITAPPP